MTLKAMNKISTIEYGDYQTPPFFAKAVCDKLIELYGLSPDIVLEPTFGVGNFLTEAIIAFPNVKKIFGVEINNNYFNAAQQKIDSCSVNYTDVKLFNADIFTFDFCAIKKGISQTDALLIIGNPPWATNSQLSSMDSSNLPAKCNFKGHTGIEAMTGRGNFDIAEYIVLKLSSEFASYDCTVALVCKTIVARNIVRHLAKCAFSAYSIDLFSFDANDIFGVNCDAGLLVMRLGRPEAKTCTVYDFHTNKAKNEFGWKEGVFCSNVRRLRSLDSIEGKCQFDWRQGLKHDCSKVMELKAIDGEAFLNGLGEVHTFPLRRYVYPLLKSSDIKSYIVAQTTKYVIVPQRRINDDTSQIESNDKHVWEYLQKHEHLLDSRRSSIYKNSPKYSIFGVGDYSFSKYKVAISGFYKKPIFSLISGDAPIMLDDTCYFIPFENLTDALITLSLLNSPACLGFLESVVFLDSKRPYTKEVLQRIDLAKLSELLGFAYVINFLSKLEIKAQITLKDFDRYRHCLSLDAPTLLLTT